VKYKITADGETFVHYECANGDDRTLCGLSATFYGDDSHDIGKAIETTKKVSCPHCLAVITHVKRILQSGE
jgi:hypothetical protein